MPKGGELESRLSGLGRSRAAAVAAARAAGYAFEPLAAGPGRPHLVGRSADGRCRVELIGPAARVFKAALIADLAADVPAAATWFLAAFAPGWRDAPAWLAARLPDVVKGGDVAAHHPRLHARLRRVGDRHAAILTLSWVPDEHAGSTPTVERRWSIPTRATRARRAARAEV